jgi:tRNA(Ile)-lysidine synthase
MPRPLSRRAQKPSAPPTSASDREPDLARRFSDSLEKLGYRCGNPAAIAVSGGGDSLALMHLFAAWARNENCQPPPAVLIVDHGLREESPGEALQTAQWAKSAGLAAHVLTWRGKKPQSNIEDAARTARYGLLGSWCAAHDLHNLFLAHTEDDQIETFLLRLGRGSGIDGLSGMRAIAPLPIPGFAGVHVLRPLLHIRRAELRAYLRDRGTVWFEDPMNEDVRYARVRVRNAMPALEAAGLSPQRIAHAVRHLARAREALQTATRDFLACHARMDSDAALLDASALGLADREIGLRALADLLVRVGGGSYRPRFERLESLFDAILAGSFAARTLAGCRVGKAPKARAAFGISTLQITPESLRQAITSARKGIGSVKKLTPALQGKEIPQISPQKGRIRPV